MTTTHHEPPKEHHSIFGHNKKQADAVDPKDPAGPAPKDPSVTPLITVATANIYLVGVWLKSQLMPSTANTALGAFPGMPVNVAVIAQNPAAAIAIVQAQYGSDYATSQGPVLAFAGALTQGTGT